MTRIGANVANDMGFVRLVLPELSYQIVGACFDAHNEIGGGQREKYYQKAVAVHLRKKGIRFREQLHAPLICDGQTIGRYILDFLVNEQIVLELKAGRSFRKADFDQVVQYLVQKKLPLGILVRFDVDSVIYRRVLRPSLSNS
ncbi:MAG: GxxExxY protein [Candidatus Uhrbacteria bacterium]